MALSDMIELTNEMQDRIVQRVPENGEGRFKMGSQLIRPPGPGGCYSTGMASRWTCSARAATR